MDQAEYQKRYDALTQRFDKAKARLEEVSEEISQKQTQRANYEAFLKAFEKLPDQLPEFTLETWHGLVDYTTVYAEDDIRFTFKNGQEQAPDHRIITRWPGAFLLEIETPNFLVF